ncbi:hypothetical protein OH809_20940 [Streptomyces sp. NBC_00873]|uniref:hypothetical protein n=1 Tax=unclassified Streptomyces TaxID=2593676 RepID=UPI0038676EB1|nr:hypothetical protein OH809_20940 [Streptomyces sp. NBC_00873]WTA45082.1 hypothetical protein OH821_22660 [Streptomyces sp. NBC_00842]
MADSFQARETDDDEGRRLLRIMRRGTRSVVTWHRVLHHLIGSKVPPAHCGHGTLDV